MVYPERKSVHFHMVDQLIDFMRSRRPAEGGRRLLHVGCSDEVEIENELNEHGIDFVSDRLDMESIPVSHPNVGRQWQASVEDMTPVADGQYDAAVADWVIEHVEDLEAAAGELFRALKPGGRLFFTCPNPQALEFKLSRYTPVRFHGLFADHQTFETHYSYRSIDDLVGKFTKKGFRLIQTKFHPAYEVYLWRFPVINLLARAWDRVLVTISRRRLLGHVFVCFQKPGPD